MFEAEDPVVYFLLFCGLVKHAIWWRWWERRPLAAKLVGRVSGLRLHPVKSCRSIDVDHLVCDFEHGPRCGAITDRSWVVVTHDYGSILTRTTTPRLALIQPAVDGSRLTLSADGGRADVTVDTRHVEERGDVKHIRMYDSDAAGLDSGDEAALWLTDFLGKPCRLLWSPPHLRKRKATTSFPKYIEWLQHAKDSDKVAYQNYAPFMLFSQESLDDLNSRSPKEFVLERFGPNIVISGNDKYDEDAYEDVMIGSSTRLRTVKLCGRCPYTLVDPATGEPDPDGEPLKLLRSYRQLVKDSVHGPCLGIVMVLERPGTIRRADPVYAVRWQGRDITAGRCLPPGEARALCDRRERTAEPPCVQ